MGTRTWGAKIWIVPIPTGSEEPWHVSNNNSHFLFLSMGDMKLFTHDVLDNEEHEEIVPGPKQEEMEPESYMNLHTH